MYVAQCREMQGPRPQHGAPATLGRTIGDVFLWTVVVFPVLTVAPRVFVATYNCTEYTRPRIFYRPSKACLFLFPVIFGGGLRCLTDLRSLFDSKKHAKTTGKERKATPTSVAVCRDEKQSYTSAFHTIYRQGLALSSQCCGRGGGRARRHAGVVSLCRCR